MALLKEATMEQGSAKMAWFGPQGSGKTMSAIQVAIGLSLKHHNGAPIAFFDTEKGSDFARPLLEAEGVKMLRVKSRAFSDLLQVVKEAEQAGCCCLIVDSMSHVWTEIMDAFCRAKKIRRIEFQHWRELKANWQSWTDAMLNSKLHMLICGRAGKQYEYQEDEETGKKELITTGTKFKAEGEFGYEPDVLVEMWTEREDATKKGSHLIHKGLVLKDRSWAINGKEFAWKDKAGYKKGDYDLVYKCFLPYFNILNFAGTNIGIDSTRSSDSMFDGNGDSAYYRAQKEKVALLEEWDHGMNLMFPGQDAKSKRARMIVGEAITGVRSKARFEAFDIGQLQQCVGVLNAVEKRLKVEAENISDDGDLSTLVEMAKEDYCENRTNDKTVLQAQLEKSLELTANDVVEAAQPF